jgi:uncharacterized OsmC-like protein
MLGTLNGALEVRGIKLEPNAISASATGVNDLVNGLVRLTEIRVQYRLRIPPGTRESVDRALSRHQEKCPTAMSLQAAVQISWTAEIEER